MTEQNTPDEHLGVALVALSNALRELEGTDWEDRISDTRDEVESALIEVREAGDFTKEQNP